MMGLTNIDKNRKKDTDLKNEGGGELGGYYDNVAGVFIMPWVSSDKNYFLKLDIIIHENKKKIDKRYKEIKLIVKRGK